MKTTLFGFFSDYELAEFARTQLMLSGVAVSRISLTAMRGAGQSRFRVTPVARENFLSALGTLVTRGRVNRQAEHIGYRVRRGIATVLAQTQSSAETGRVAAILRNCGAVDVAEDAGNVEAEAETDHEESWPSYSWPASS